MRFITSMVRVAAGWLVCLGGGGLGAADLLIEGVERGQDGRVSVRFVGDSVDIAIWRGHARTPTNGGI